MCVCVCVTPLTVDSHSPEQLSSVPAPGWPEAGPDPPEAAGPSPCTQAAVIPGAAGLAPSAEASCVVTLLSLRSLRPARPRPPPACRCPPIGCLRGIPPRDCALRVLISHATRRSLCPFTSHEFPKMPACSKHWKNIALNVEP